MTKGKMADRPAVEINRTCLSLLFRDNALSPGDQEGFLVGEVIERDKKISDTQENTGTALVIRVIATFPIPKNFKLYNGIGRINTEALKTILGSYGNKIVGFYDFKRNLHSDVQHSISFAQKNVFTEMCKLKGSKGVEPLIFMQLRQNHDTSSKHKYNSQNIIVNNYNFLLLDENRAFVKLASIIPNLGDTSHDRYVQNGPVSEVDVVFKGMEPPHSKTENLPVVEIHNSLFEKLNKAAETAAKLEAEYTATANKLSSTVRLLADAKLLPRSRNTQFEDNKEDTNERISGSPIPSTSTACNVKQTTSADSTKVTTRSRKKKHSSK